MKRCPNPPSPLGLGSFVGSWGQQSCSSSCSFSWQKLLLPINLNPSPSRSRRGQGCSPQLGIWGDLSLVLFHPRGLPQPGGRGCSGKILPVPHSVGVRGAGGDGSGQREHPASLLPLSGTCSCFPSPPLATAQQLQHQHCDLFVRLSYRSQSDLAALT